MCILCRIKLLGDICYASLEGYFTLRGIFGYDVGLGPYYV